MPRYITVVEITGCGPFPMDMLRYDQCWPATADDAATIARSCYQPSDRYEWMVRVKKHVPSKREAVTLERWTLGRWQSFACDVKQYDFFPV